MNSASSISAHSTTTEVTGWTKEQELLLQNWGEKAQGHSWLHKRSEKYYEKRSNAITIPTAIIAGLSGSVQFSLINDDSENFWIKLGTALTTLSVSILSLLQKTLNYQSFQERHRKMAIDFGSLHRDISAELSIPQSERQNSKEYINKCRADMDKLTKASPNVPDDIINEFNKRFKNVDVHKPNMAEGIKPIILYDKSIRVESHYKRELKRKLHMQGIFYKWKYAMNAYQNKNNKRNNTDEVAIDITEKEPLITKEPTELDVNGVNIELSHPREENENIEEEKGDENV